MRASVACSTIPGADIALGANTHDLVVRLLSALPLARPTSRIVTTDGEFHTLRRQFDRLEEEGIEIVRVPAAPARTLAERLGLEKSTAVPRWWPCRL